MAKNLAGTTRIGTGDADFLDGLFLDPSQTRVSVQYLQDMVSFFQKLMALAGLSPNGNFDNETNGYQFLEALRAFPVSEKTNALYALLQQRFDLTRYVPRPSADNQYLKLFEFSTDSQNAQIHFGFYGGATDGYYSAKGVIGESLPTTIYSSLTVFDKGSEPTETATFPTFYYKTVGTTVEVWVKNGAAGTSGLRRQATLVIEGIADSFAENTQTEITLNDSMLWGADPTGLTAMTVRTLTAT